MIPIYYRNGTFDLVHPGLLDALLAAGRVEKFCRHGEWVQVGRDAVRSNDGLLWKGGNRRALH